MDMHKVDIFFDQTLKSPVRLYHTALPDNDLAHRFPIKRIPGAGHSMFVIAMSAYLVAR